MPTMQHIIPKRMVIYAKDIENITGRKERTARKLLQKIREKYGKQKGDFITVDEFCEYTGLKENKVQEYLLN